MIDFETVLRLRQPELKEALGEELLEMGYPSISRKGFLYAPGEIPVLLVAHMDTVHYEPPSIICYSKDGRYIMSPQGIGGDDRAGVYMILQILQRVNCHVLFCEDEESGGHGAKAFTKSGIKMDVNYIIELDRKGDNDAVYYGCDNPEFREFIHSFGFQESIGSFSDISILAPHLKTAAVNLSTGYYYAHRNHEMIDTAVMAKNAERITEMVMTPTDHFAYQAKFTKCTGFLKTGALFDSKITDLNCDGSERKLLMWLPADARLMVGAHELRSSQRYLIDRSGAVYAYIESLNAAVESEILMACDTNGYEVQFRYSNAEHMPVLSYEEAMSKLMDIVLAT